MIFHLSVCKFVLLDYQFIIRRYNSGTAKWKRYIGQGMRGLWREAAIPSPGALLSQHITVFTNAEAPRFTLL